MVKIISDSTCDLSPAQLQELNVDLARLTVIKDGVSYTDGETITPADIFAHVAAGGDLCSTTAVSIGEYIDFFTPFAEEYEGVVHINLGSGFSSTHQNACLAAEDFPNVRVVDSMNLSTGQGLVVLEAHETVGLGNEGQESHAQGGDGAADHPVNCGGGANGGGGLGAEAAHHGGVDVLDRRLHELLQHGGPGQGQNGDDHGLVDLNSLFFHICSPKKAPLSGCP